MKGVILAGGMGTRLHPLTKVTNKHLLPIYNKPMIYYPIRSMVKSGIDEIMLVTGGNAAGDFLQLLGNGKELGVRNLQYTYQEKPSGIADALSLAEDFADNDPICVMLGDNILEKDFGTSISKFLDSPRGARIFVTRSERPQCYGVVEFEEATGRVLSVEEKPARPKSNYIAIGLYMYDRSVWDKIASLTPSQRGELEVTDLNRMYLKAYDEELFEWMPGLRMDVVEGWWGDAGESFETYLDAQNKVKELGL